jgi:hypothetical protein
MKRSETEYNPVRLFEAFSVLEIGVVSGFHCTIKHDLSSLARIIQYCHLPSLLLQQGP